MFKKRVPLCEGFTSRFQDKIDVGSNRPAQQNRLLKHHGLTGCDLRRGFSAPLDPPSCWLDQSMQQFQQHAFASAIRTHDHRAATGGKI